MRTKEEKIKRKRTSILSSNFFQISSSTLHYNCQLDDDVLALNNYVFMRKKLEISLLGIDDVYVCGVRKKNRKNQRKIWKAMQCYNNNNKNNNSQQQRTTTVCSDARAVTFYYKRRLFTQFGDEF